MQHRKLSLASFYKNWFNISTLLNSPRLRNFHNLGDWGEMRCCTSIFAYASHRVIFLFNSDMAESPYSGRLASWVPCSLPRSCRPGVNVILLRSDCLMLLWGSTTAGGRKKKEKKERYQAGFHPKLRSIEKLPSIPRARFTKLRSTASRVCALG